MVVLCCVIGCTNRFDKKDPKSFYRIPKKPVSRRKLWISAIKRDNWEPTDNDRVCFRHFITGTKSHDDTSPDFTPSVHMGYQESSSKGELRFARYQRQGQREHQKQKTAAASALLDLSNIENFNISPSTLTPEVGPDPEINRHDNCIKKIAALTLENQQLYTELGRLQADNTRLAAELKEIGSFEQQVTSTDRKLLFTLVCNQQLFSCGYCHSARVRCLHVKLCRPVVFCSAF
ncbi:THAP domain-containing protein 4-like [Mizuhopecten yessoensis]|uniref:THAP domain-containing protein 4-like n=1 Tax=Mizuhopecten yessoensis TaxID=6573 RepID=UPI000B45BB57|nr:THAP domain-containing protein 4-like [Mizuhopecten yessoensis]